MIADLTRHLDEVSVLCERYGVRRLELIGSGAKGALFDRSPGR